MRARRGAIAVTDRDAQVLRALSFNVRVLSTRQIARTWFGAGKNGDLQARRRLGALRDAGLIERFVMHARPELSFVAPLLAWSPGKDEAEFDRIAYQLASRWTAKPEPTELWVSTAAAAVPVGGEPGHKPRASEVSHDVSLAGLFLHFLAQDPTVAKAWISEARLRNAGFGDWAKLPDAMLASRTPPTIVELGGMYPAPKLRSFHAFCVERQIPYELW